MNRRTLAAVTVAAATLALVMPGAAHAATSSAVSSPPPVLGLSTAPDQSPAAAIADAAEQVAQARFAGLYVGEVLTDNGSHVVVYLTQLQPSAEAAITAGTQPGTISFALAPRSLAYLDALNAGVTSAETALLQQGITIVTWGPDFVTGREDITVLDLNAARTALLDQEFGATNLVLSTTSVGYAGIALAGRAADSPPWNGGDYTIIHVSSFNIACTSGFGVSGGRKKYLLEAAHCAAKNAKVYNASPSGKGKQHLMGSVSSQGEWKPKNGIDAEVINTTSNGGSSKAVDVGSSSSKTLADVSGSASSRRGDQVCDDGAFEGQVCQLVIQNSMTKCAVEALSVAGPFYRICDLYQVKQLHGHIAAGDGDSGGPVYRYKNNKLYATGLITLSDGNSVKCPTENYPYVGGQRACYSEFYYTSISSILREFKVSLNT